MLVAYVFANPTLHTYIRFDEMGYANIVNDFTLATIFSPDKVGDYTKALTMSHLKGFKLTSVHTGI